MSGSGIGKVLGLLGIVAVSSIVPLLKSCARMSDSFVHSAPHIIAELPVQVVRPAPLVADRILAEEAQTAAKTSHTLPFETDPLPPSGVRQSSSIIPAHVGMIHDTPDQASKWKPLSGEIITTRRFAVGAQSNAVNKTHLLAAFPVEESQFKDVYKTSQVSMSSVAEMRRLRTKVASTNQRGEWSLYTGNTPFVDELKKYPSTDLFGIIAHFDNKSGTLIMPNGTAMSFEDLHRSCGEVKVKCVVISCYSPDLDLKSEIATEDAIKIWSTANKKRSTYPAPTSDDFILDLRKGREKTISSRAIVFSTVVAVGGATGGFQLHTSRKKS